MLRLIGTREADRPPKVAPSAMPGDPLRALVSRAVAGEAGAERTLLIAVGPAILAIVRRVIGPSSSDVDDVCQESAIALLTALPTFRAECSVLHFACRVALLTALSARRRARYHSILRADDSTEPDHFIDDQPSPAELLDATRRRRTLRELLDALPMAQAEVLALHVVLGYTVEETSAMTNAQLNTVRSRLRRALAALRVALGGGSSSGHVHGGRDD